LSKTGHESSIPVITTIVKRIKIAAQYEVPPKNIYSYENYGEMAGMVDACKAAAKKLMLASCCQYEPTNT
jgi:hypothetical protein